MGISTGLQSRSFRLIALLSLLGLVVIIASAFLATRTQDKWLDDLWIEVAKAGVWVVGVGVLGGALGAIWKSISARLQEQIAADEKERDRDIERNEKMRAELVALVNMYNEVKAVRRTLRSLGFDPKYRPELAGQEHLLSLEQVRGFHGQMLILNGLQLDFEAKARQFGQTNLLREETEQVVKHLGKIESHLNQVLELWEHSGWRVQEGADIDVVSKGLEGLIRVRQNLRPNVSDPLREITRTLINMCLVRRPRRLKRPFE